MNLDVKKSCEETYNECEKIILYKICKDVKNEKPLCYADTFVEYYIIYYIIIIIILYYYIIIMSVVT